MSKAKTPTFNEAMRELEAILQEVESEETDIDQLATQLKRSAELLDLCRGKIRRAEVEVSQIVQSLDDGETTERQAADGAEDLSESQHESASTSEPEPPPTPSAAPTLFEDVE